MPEPDSTAPATSGLADESTAAEHNETPRVEAPQVEVPTSTLRMLTPAMIRAAQDIEYETVDVPEWGGVVTVRALNGTERDAFEQSLVVGHGRGQRVQLHNVRARLCSLTIVDPTTRERMFGDQDVTWLGQKSAAALDRVYTVAARLAKITDEDVEELVGNSESDRSDGSSSPSRSRSFTARQTNSRRGSRRHNSPS